jgi:hypothetical protein
MNGNPIASPLSSAKAAVMSAIKRLEKLHENKHAGYSFASVDDFKDELRPLFAKNGIDLHVSEESYDLTNVKSTGKDGKEKDSIVAKIRFRFVLNHISGEKSEPTFFTVCLPYTGAQTSGAAQSYAIKEGVYKGLFQASSGDVSEEADLQSTAQRQERLSKADARPLFEALQREMRAIETETKDSQELADWWRSNIEQLNSLPLDWFLTIKKECAEIGARLKAMEAADKILSRSAS